MKVSIIVLTRNALRYCRKTFKTIRRTRDVRYELIVVDNASFFPTRLYLGLCRCQGRIQRLCYLDRNTLFAEGNNIGAAISSRDSTHLLLLNSDVEGRDPSWLAKLLAIHRPGASSYGYVRGGPWPRADGFCFLIDRELYLRYGLCEEFPWWWSVTKLQAQLLRDGYSVRAVARHDHLLHHCGGKSGDGYLQAGSLHIDSSIVEGWFAGNQVTLINTID